MHSDRIRQALFDIRDNALTAHVLSVGEHGAGKGLGPEGAAFFNILNEMTQLDR